MNNVKITKGASLNFSQNFFNIPLRYKLYYEKQREEENMGKESAERIMNLIKNPSKPNKFVEKALLDYRRESR